MKKIYPATLDSSKVKCKSVALILGLFIFLIGITPGRSEAQSISVTNVTSTPVCAGTDVTVSFDVINGSGGSATWYSNSTDYQIFLSDAGGTIFTPQGTTFNNATQIYDVTDGGTTTGLTQTFTIPAATAAGVSYKISIGSLGPVFDASTGSGASNAFTINAISASPGTITGTATLCDNATGNAYSITAVSGATGYTWSYSGTGATINGTGTNITIDFATGATSGTLSVTADNTCGSSTPQTQAITINTKPAIPGSITGSSALCENTTGNAYSITAVTGATGYTWSYSGTGATINGTGTNITIDFATGATSGTLSVTADNTCGSSTPQTQAITINTKPAIPGSITGSSALCENTTGNAYSIAAVTGATGYTWSYSGTAATINGTGTNITIDFAIGATSGTLSVSADNTCGSSATQTLGITITPGNTITLTSIGGTDAQTLCINTAITNITYSTTGATGATFSGLPAGVTGNWAANVVTISGTPTASGPFSYTVTTTGGCTTPAVTASGTITVTANNTITLTSAAGTNAQTKCINTAITNITYSTTGATGATFSGLPAGVTGNWAANVVTISGTPTASGPFSYTVTTTGGCTTPAVTASGTITVTANNTITLTSAAGTNAQTKCINTAITNITYSTTGATGATFSGLPAGVTGNWAANVVTISGTPTASGLFSYTVTTTGGCTTPAVTASGTITVTANNTITLTSAAGTNAQTKCINTAITNITYSTTGATGATFSGLPAGVTGNWAANVVTISGTPTASGPFSYTVTTTGGCTTPAVTASGTITVTANNTITLTSAAGTNAQTKCINTAITNITYSTTGATGATFSGLPAGVTGNWAANVVTISGTPTASGPFSYTVTTTGGCTTPAVTASGSITVNAPPLTTGVTICQGGSGSLSSSAGCAAGTPGTAGPNFAGTGSNNNGTGTLAWSGTGNIFANDGSSATATVSSGGNTTVTTQYLQATNFGFAIPATANISGIQVSINRFSSQNTGSNNVQDNIVSLVKGGAITGNDNSVAGNWSTTNTTVANYGTTVDLWGTTWTPAQINAANFGVALSATINRTSGQTDIASVDYITITVSYTIPGTLNWYTVSSGGVAIGNGSPFNPVGVSGSGLANTNTPGTYTFYAECTSAAPGCRTATNFIINAQPTSFNVGGTGTYCSTTGGHVTLSGSTSGVNYQLFRGATGLSTLAGTGSALDFGLQTIAGTYTVVATNTTTSCNATMTGSAVISITPIPNTTFTYSSYTYCATGTSGSANLSGSPTTGTFSASPAGLNFSNTSTGVINLATSTPGTYSITYTVPASGGCAAYSYTQPTSIVINAQPALFTVGGTGTYCSTSGGDVTLSGSTSGLNYKLFRGATGLGTLAGTGSSLDFGFQTIGGTYTVVATNPTTGCTATMNGSAVITITPTPNTTFTYSSYTYCATGSSGTANLSGSPTTGTFSALPAGLNFSNTSTGIINLATSTPGTYSITYTVPASGGCAVYSYTQSNSIVINTLPTLFSVTGGGSYCSGGTGVPVGLSGSQSGVNYQLKNGAANVGGPVAGTGSAISFGNQTIATTYSVVATNAVTGCQSTMSGNATVTINALPAAPTITPASAIVCQGTIQSLFSGTTTTGNASGNSTTNNVTITNNSSTGVANTINLSGIPAGSTINSISVQFNITEGNDGDLVINLKAPNANVLNLVNRQGGTGNNFNNTIISSIGSTLLSSSGPDYNNTYAADAVIGAVGASAGGGNTSNVGSFNSFYSTATDLNGIWQFSVRDAASSGGNGTLGNWSITINYTTPAAPQSVTWSPATDLFTDAGATTAYISGTSIATVYSKPSTSGTKTYTATTTNAQGCTNSTNVVLTVNPQPTGTLTTPLTTVCQGTTVTFTATTGYGAYIFRVNGIIVQAGTGNVYNVDTLSNGAQVTVDVANSSNCGATFGPVIMTINPLPTPTLTANKLSICPKDTVTFTAGGGTNYNFKLNGSSVQSGPSATYKNWTLNDGDSVTVDVTNANGCLATSSKVVISVNPIPAGSLSATENSGTTPNDNKICAGDDVTFTATAGTGNTYNFKVNGVTAQNTTSGTFTTSFIANAVVSVDVTNASGCTTTFGPPQVITVNALPSGTLTATENSGIPNNNVICAGSSVTFTATAGTGNSYKFYLRGTGLPLYTGPSNIYSTSSLVDQDYLTVVVTNSNGCSSTYTSPVITVAAIPLGTLSASANTICSGDGIDFTATTGFSNYNFKVNGVSFQNGTSNLATHAGFAEGDIVTVDVSNAATCAATFNSLTIHVNPLPAGSLIPVENSGVAANDSIICAGARVVFTATSGYSNYNFKLNGTTVLYGSSDSYPTDTLKNGDVVTVEVTSALGCVASFNTATMTVNPLPTVVAITGPDNVCVNSTITLANASAIPPGGSFVWKSENMAIATVDPSTGLVTGKAAGTVIIDYTVTSAAGCSSFVSISITVNDLPLVDPITGQFNLCTNSTSPLSDATTGGVWSSSNNGIASVDAFGLVTAGASPGTVTISYTFTNANGCSTTVTADVIVASTPGVAPITTTAPSFDVCVGSTIQVKDATPSGVWSSVNPSIATISASGVVTGIADGIDSIIYTIDPPCFGTVSDTQVVVVHAVPITFNVTGGGAYCMGGTGVTIGLSGSEPGVNYQLYKGANTAGSPVSGTGTAIDFGLQTAAGNYTVVATNAITSCTSNMTGSQSVSVNPLPIAYNVTGGGAYCSGGTGVTIGLSNSQTGVNYQLQIGGVNTGSPIAGTNAAISFGLQTAAGTYTLVATNATTSCTSNMTGSQSISVNPLPTTYNVTGGGAYCSGGTGINIGLSNSQTGVNYQLQIGGVNTGSPVAGTNAAISFGPQTTAGNYTVVATNAITSCTSNMSGNAVISVNSLPTAYSVTGGGTYCGGGTGVAVGLSNSQTGINYQLQIGGVNTGSPVAGTNAPISFGLQTAAGTYTVVATDATTSCTSNMTGNATITVNAHPTGVLSGTQAICAGGSATITLSVTGSGTITGTLSDGTSFSGTAPSISIGVTPVTTTIYSIATLSDANCTANVGEKTGSATVTVNTPTLISAVTASPSGICLGDNTNLVASGPTPPGILFSENFNAGTSGAFTLVNGAPFTYPSSTPRPRQWTNEPNNYNYVDAPAGINVTFRPGSRFMVSVSDTVSGNYYVNTALVSPVENTAGYSTLTLQYDTYYRAWYNDIADAEVSTDNGATWTVVDDLYAAAGGNGGSVGASNRFTTRSVNLNAYVNQATLLIRFRYVANDGYYFALDNISLSGTSASYNFSWTASPAATAGLPAGAGTPSLANASIVASPTAAGTYLYTATLINSTGCASTKNVTVTVNPAPTVTITANYCVTPGKVQLTANGSPGVTSYLWSTGETTQIINVDIAAVYQVTAFIGATGCGGNASIQVAQELVTNGDFQSGNTGFTSDYLYIPDGAGNSELIDDTGNHAYSVTTSGQNVHPNFWGYDHTTGDGTGNYMLVNGHLTNTFNSSDTLVIWKETVNVLPNTTYYFAAWAMSLNNVGPFAQLKFSVNGALVGTTAILAAGTNSNSNNGWVRFYGTWTSGPTTTTADIYINDLQPSQNGNDFGLDDVSFATLSTFITLESAPGTDAQTVCVNTPITNIVYSVGNGNPSGPTVTGLPAGITSVFAGDKLTISGTPTVPGNYTYTITTNGCKPYSVTGTIKAQAQKLTLKSGNASPSICINTAITPIVYQVSGSGGSAATVKGLPSGLTGVYQSSDSTFTISGTPTVAGVFKDTVISTGMCRPDTAYGTITVQNQTIVLSSGDTTQTVCVNNAIGGIIYTLGGTATDATLSGLPANITGFYSGGSYIISGTPTTPGIYHYTVTTTGTCSPAAVTTGTIAVNPDATITLSSGVNTDNQVVCKNGPLTDITYNIVGGGTGASITSGALPAGVTGSFNTGIFTIHGTPAVAGIFNYTITTTGTCVQASVSGTITVQQQTITLTSGSTSPTNCLGSNLTSIVFTIGGTATSASLSSGSFPTGVSGLYDNTAKTYTISGTLMQLGTFPYTIKTTGTCSPDSSLSGTITVNNGSVGGSLPGMVVICGSGSGTLNLTGNTGNVQRWESSTDGGTTWTNIANTTTTLPYTNLSVPTQYRALVKSGSCAGVYSSIALVAIHNYWVGGTGTDWNTASNWSDGAVPTTSCSDVYIPNTINKPVLSGAPVSTITNLHVAAGASVTINGSGHMQIGGTITNAGIFDVTAGTLEFNGTSQSVSGSLFKNRIINDLIVSSTAGTTLTVSNTAGDTLNITDVLSFGNTTADLNTGGNITLKSSAAATASLGQLASGNVITGDVTVERYIATGTTGDPNHGKSWQLLATPTQGQTIKASWGEGATATNIASPAAGSAGNPHAGYGTMLTSDVANAIAQPTPGFDAFTSPGPSIKVYNSATTLYDGPASTALPIYNQKGYFVFVRGDRSVYTSTGAATPTILRTKGTLFTPANLPLSTTVAADEFGSVGNPYASAIDFTKVGKVGGNIDQFFIVWDPRLGGAYNYGAFQYFYFDGTNYKSLNTSPTYGPAGTINNYIQNGQAFLVQTTGASGTVSFNESCKVGSNVLFTTPNPVSQVVHSLHTSLNTVNSDGSTGSVLDGILSHFGDTYNNAVDGMDARKSMNTGENLAIKTAGKLLAIERRHTITQQDTIFLNITGVRNQPYRFHFDAENLDPSVQGYVVDNFTGARTPLNMTGATDVDFTVANVTGSNAANRFMIVFEPLKALPVTFTSIKAYRQDKNIDVEWRVDNEVNMKQYDVEKSTDGNTFTGIAQQQPTANNGGSAVYVSADASPVTGFNYYRVKSTDINGKISYTNVVKVLIGTIKQDITIYPNPITDGMIHLQFLNEPAGKYNIRLLNKLGQVILRQQVTRADGNGTEYIKWDYNLAHGMYQLEITRPDGSVKDINVMY